MLLKPLRGFSTPLRPTVPRLLLSRLPIVPLLNIFGISSAAKESLTRAVSSSTGWLATEGASCSRLILTRSPSFRPTEASSKSSRRWWISPRLQAQGCLGAPTRVLKPGALAYLWVWLDGKTLLFGQSVWDVGRICHDYQLDISSHCWPFKILSMRQGAEKLTLRDIEKRCHCHMAPNAIGAPSHRQRSWQSLDSRDPR